MPTRVQRPLAEKPGLASRLRSSRVDNFPILIIVLAVLSMRGASRGVLEAGQSARRGAIRNARLTDRGALWSVDAASRALCLASTVREALGHRPGLLRGSAAVCRLDVVQMNAGEIPRHAAPGRTVRSPKSPRNGRRLETVCGARRKAIRDRLAGRDAPLHAPCRRAPAPRRAETIAKLGLKESREREAVAV
jgi:hypothetical protein